MNVHNILNQDNENWNVDSNSSAQNEFRVLQHVNILEQSNWLSTSSNYILMIDNDLPCLTLTINSKNLNAWIKEMIKQEIIITNKCCCPQDVSMLYNNGYPILKEEMKLSLLIVHWQTHSTITNQGLI